MAQAPRSVFNETDADAVTLARTLLRNARLGALATLDPESGTPLASRVAMATDADGAPVILTSRLAAHTRAILADPRCALLVGEPGKGDPLAHPRLSVNCRARRLDRADPVDRIAVRRYLNRNGKAKLYADFADFSYFRLEPVSALLNGGFGRAYRLDPPHLLVGRALALAIAETEEAALHHMNAYQAEAVSTLARHHARSHKTGWRLTGVDADGCDLARGDENCRIPFQPALASPLEIRERISALVQIARGTA